MRIHDHYEAELGLEFNGILNEGPIHWSQDLTVGDLARDMIRLFGEDFQIFQTEAEKSSFEWRGLAVTIERKIV